MTTADRLDGAGPLRPVQPHPEIIVHGTARTHNRITRGRIAIVAALLVAGFLLIGARLVQLGQERVDDAIEGVTRDVIQASRPPIVDRNGIAIAIDIRVPSLYAEPRRIVDVANTVAQLRTVLPDLDESWLRARLSGDKGFVWLKRELTPAIENAVMALGLPGIDFIEESKRFYPAGSELAHVIGSVNIDNQGIAGTELAIDRDDLAVLQDVGLARGAELKPRMLSIDSRVQYVMRSELLAALARFRAIAAAGAILDIRTGEVISMVSLPDFDPNEPATALRPDRFNRITNGTFELGSTFKTITIAAALDSGAVAIDDMIDAREGVRFGRFLLDHGRHEIMSVSDVFRYSDNIGTIRIMERMGKDRLRAFLGTAGFDQRSAIELPERAAPRVPESFSDVGAATASYGYGFAATPMHMLTAVAALMNKGRLVPPTLFRRSEVEAEQLARPIVSEKTSEEMRYLFRMNALLGSGRNMDAEAIGYRTGGKTGTAEKTIDGRYSKTKNVTVFTSAFPMEDPRYAMLVMLDEAQAENARSTREAGWNVAVVSGRIIQRIAPMLGILPSTAAGIDGPLMRIGAPTAPAPAL
ncbi:MAG TPA: penicillin-binding protein 2 [Devosia sp.]|jgi:cell division protein FtsI (penicillin-binding protein 3)|uniref:peptidoglycan D,D-transpeptidase FtsI family protein n=1 Tax=Devosia sp. TaxID=1871048 RepID=UPI002DDCFB51|nr:penicillin-binding protein 2 [Devosia sp.]HEV2516873.1 penicillin-binding protein 2 [Devosia sp.]